MRVLDLFSGMGGWTQAFEDRGHDVFRIELDEKYPAEMHGDILEVTPELLEIAGFGEPDLILASPPCEKFSIMAVSHYWRSLEAGFVPKNEAAIHGLRLAMHALYLIEALQPKAAIMENPRGMMRKILPVKPQVTVTYCQYGDTRMKPTDLWLFGGASRFYFKPVCRNGSPCHEASPRGSRTGTQTPMSYQERSLVPLGLSLAVCEQMEALLADRLTPGRLEVAS